MRELSDEEILAIWTTVTDYTESWQEIINDLLSRIDQMQKLADEEDKGYYEELREEIKQLQRDIEAVVDKARSGEISEDDLENEFRSFAEALDEYETRLLHFEWAGEEYDFEEEEEEEEEF